MKETFLKVVTVDAPVKDKDGIPYKRVVFQGINLIGGREVNVKGTVVRNFWPASYERMVNGEKSQFRGDAEYDSISIGDLYAGHVFTCETTPYAINDGPTINTWRGLVFEGENPLVIAARALRQNDAKPKHLDEATGQMIVFSLQPTGKKVLTPSEEEEEQP